MVNSLAGFNIGRTEPYQTSSRSSTLKLVQTHSKHLLGTGDAEQIAIEQTQDSSFGEMLVAQVTEVSALENKAQDLATQFLIDPESVNEHDLTIASSQATLAVSIMTNIVSRALESYRAIISLQ